MEVLLSIGTTWAIAEATCNIDQRQLCSQAVADDRLARLPSGGECIAKRYVQFTHLCSVYNYLPHVDYCCCHSDDQVTLCCRYHQDWNHFRCLETEDYVSTSKTDSNDTGDAVDGSLSFDAPLRLFICVFVGLVFTFVSCVLCCLKGCYVGRCHKALTMSDNSACGRQQQQQRSVTTNNTFGAGSGRGDLVVRNPFPVSGFQPDPEDKEVTKADDRRTSPKFSHDDDDDKEEYSTRPEPLPPLPPPSPNPRNSSNDVRGLIPSAPDLSELSNEFGRYASSFAPSYPRTEFEGYDCVVLSNPYVPVAVPPAPPLSVVGPHRLRPVVTSRHPLYVVCRAGRPNDVVRACPVCSKPRIKGYSSCDSTKMPSSGGYGVFV